VTAASGSARRVLYISHNGLTEALGRRQVLPYLVGLAARGWQITLLSFEKAETAQRQAVANVERITSEAGILWKPLRYHNRPPVVATAYDIIRGCQRGRSLARDISLIHARSTVPALMADLLSRRLGLPWVFDLRGLLAEEYVDAGHWPRGGVRHRVTAAVELRLLRSADGLVTLTRKILDRLPARDGLGPDRPTTVIPCSVDLGVFRPSEEWRREIRSDLGWGDEPVLVYSGSLGSWYRLGEMLDFFEVAREEIGGLRFLLLTPQVALAEQEVRSRQLVGRVVARAVAPDAVPRYLAAGDAGICFLGRYTSKDASSPTKYGEYLAVGLPVVTSNWIGDAHDLAVERPWLLVEAFDPSAYRKASLGLARLLDEPAATRLAARDLARREFALEMAIDRYHDLYMKVLVRRARARS
jgi:glycosyltransferase involved in cell wall biosynthesis